VAYNGTSQHKNINLAKVYKLPVTEKTVMNMYPTANAQEIDKGIKSKSEEVW